jgi:hypothetical protein
MESTVGQADLVGSHPTGEALLVVAGEVGGCCRPVEIVDIETLRSEGRPLPPRVAPPMVFARRSSFLDGWHHASSLV